MTRSFVRSVFFFALFSLPLSAFAQFGQPVIIKDPSTGKAARVTTSGALYVSPVGPIVVSTGGLATSANQTNAAQKSQMVGATGNTLGEIAHPVVVTGTAGGLATSANQTNAAQKSQMVGATGNTLGEIAHPVIVTGTAGSLAVNQAFTVPQNFRESFSGAAFSGSWTVVAGAGQTVTVAAGKAVFTSGTTANSKSYISRGDGFYPMILSVKFVETARAAASTGLDFFFGLYNTADPNVATQYVEWFFPGVGVATASECRTQAHAGAGGSEGIGVNVARITTLSDFFSQIALQQDSAVFRDGQVTLPNTTVEATRSADLPDFGTNLFVAMGFRNAAVVGAVPVTASVDTVMLDRQPRSMVDVSF